NNYKVIFYNTETKNLFNVSTILDFYNKADWWGEKSDDDLIYIKKIMEKSFLFAGFFVDDKLSGMGRVIGDGVSDLYIQDIFISEIYRKRGFGSILIEEIISEIKKRGDFWVALIGEPGTENFYNKLGFEKMKNYAPMFLKQ
ncbi:MAG: GNAT family N-acetyltransferase, partial [Candidatus Muiribacteriota bacterium]